MKKKAIVLATVVAAVLVVAILAPTAIFLLSSSSTEATGTEAGPAESQILHPLAERDPVTGLSFHQEFEKKKSRPSFLKPKLGVFIKWLKGNPQSLYKDLHAHYPVLELESLPIKNLEYSNGGTVVVSRYSDVVEVLSNHKLFSVRNNSKKMTDVMGPFMLGFDSTDYNIKEKPWMRAMMTRDDLKKIEIMAADLARQLIRENSVPSVRDTRTKNLELVNAVGRQVPALITEKYFGFKGPNVNQLISWSRDVQDEFFKNITNDPNIKQRAVKTGAEMHVYLTDYIATQVDKNQKGEDIGDTVLARLLKSEHKEFAQPLNENDSRLRTNVMGTLIGGIETTQAAIAGAMYEILSRPEVRSEAIAAAKKNDLQTVSRIVFEALRYQPVAPVLIRFAEEDHTFPSGLRIEKGSHLLVLIQAAMFDSSVASFQNPEKFDWNRDPKSYLHFGFGHHACLGEYVARTVVPAAVGELLKLENLKMVYEAEGIDLKKLVKTKALGQNEYIRFFPEKLFLNYLDSAAAVGADAALNELNEYDVSAYRECLTGLSSDIPGTQSRSNWARIKLLQALNSGNSAKELFFCKLNQEFRSCMAAGKVDVSRNDSAQVTLFESCQRSLSPSVATLYRDKLIEQKLQLSATEIQPVSINVEDGSPIYDVLSYRSCFIDPLCFPSDLKSKHKTFYAKLNPIFLNCVKDRIGLMGRIFARTQLGDAFQVCKGGVYNRDLFRNEGALNQEEVAYFTRHLL